MRHLKRDVLRFLADGQCHDARSVAQGVRYAERRSMSSYLRRLERQRLIQSSYFGRAVAFRITAKGIARLRFFLAHPSYDFLRRQSTQAQRINHARQGSPIARQFVRDAKAVWKRDFDPTKIEQMLEEWGT